MTNEPDDFEKMLEESLVASPIGRRPELGEKVRGAVLAITSEYVLVDLGAKTEGVLDKADLLDADGALTVSVGDEIEAFVTGVEGEIQLSVRVRTGDGSDAVLQAAFEGGLPIEGLVTAVNKGGLEVKVGKKRGFCPLSQIELGYCEDPSIYLGQKLEFRISKLGGRDLLLSRRALLEAERKVQADALWQTLAEGDVLPGEVSRVAAFGAFVDLGGIDGLIHISEFSHERVEDPGSMLSQGQKVTVQVVSVDREAGRVGLSLKALADDPWDTVVERFPPGTQIAGKVTRLAAFGAFVALGEGIEGLAHISELADRRISHPKEVVAQGDTVQVRVLDVDPERRRISLSLREAQETPDGLPLVGSTVTAIVDRIESYGLFVRFAGHRGLVPGAELPDKPASSKELKAAFPEGTQLEVRVIEVDEESGRIRLSVNAVVAAKDRKEWEQFQKQSSGEGFGTTLGDLLAKRIKK